MAVFADLWKIAAIGRTEPDMQMSARIVVATTPTLQAGLAALLAAGSALDVHPAGPDGEIHIGPEDLPYDIAILDADLLGSRLPDVLARARRRGFCGAVVLLCGADDAAEPSLDPSETPERVRRPFHIATLRTAIETALAQRATNGEAALANLRLTEKEAAIFGRLARAGGAAVDRQRLLDEIWGCAPDVTTRTLETHIHRLRRKIEAAPPHGWRLTTAPGGYSLTKKTVDDSRD
jgi:DNA-binding response OmpR family regulator